jgi:hypothetical protein
MRLASFALISSLLVPPSLIAIQTERRLVFLYGNDGRANAYYEVRSVPYEPGGRLAMRRFNRPDRDQRDQEGHVVSGIAMYAWQKDNDVTLVILKMIPRDGRPNRYFGYGEDDNLQVVELTRLSLHVGVKTKVDKLTSLGFDPIVVSLETHLPDGVPRR